MTTIPDDVLRYYSNGQEQDRLLSRHALERERTQQLLTRYLPPAPAMVLDVGGAAGAYALWLAKLGYAVHVIDPVQLHTAQAQVASSNQPEHPLASAMLGDARCLDWPDACADAVLMLGPLYHLTERSDRLQALREGFRVLKPGGPIFAAAISRFASALDGIRRGFLADPLFASLVEEDLRSGQHRNPTSHEHYFATAFFHHPDELRAEITEAGFADTRVTAIEGIGWFIPTNGADQMWENEHFREAVLQVLRMTETEPAILGASGHLMGIGRKL
jgi:ubiquinone/menaquinone biosynthesis C-methylase UbiE